MPEPPLNEPTQEIATLDAMFDALSPREAQLFRAQLDRIKRSWALSITQLMYDYKSQQAIVAGAVADVMLDVAATQHDLEASKRERDLLYDELHGP